MDLILVNQAENTSSTTSVTDVNGLSSESRKADTLKGQVNKESNLHGEKTLCDRFIDMVSESLGGLLTKIYNAITGKPTSAQIKDFRLGLIREVGRHLDQEGIYRISAGKNDVDQLMAKQRETIPQGTLSGDLAVGALKRSLTEQPLFPPGAAFSKTAHLFNGTELRDGVTKEQVLDTLKEGLSEDNKEVFDALVQSMQAVAKNPSNKMTVANLGTTPGTALFPSNAKTMEQAVDDPKKAAALVKKLLAEEKPQEELPTIETTLDTEFAKGYDAFVAEYSLED